MTKSATDVMQEILVSAVIDSIVALKDAAKGVPNTLVRDLGAIHANTTFADLPPALQAAIVASVRASFTRLLKEGYSVSPGRGAPERRPPPRREGSGPPPRPRGPSGPPRGRPGGGKPPRGAGGGGRPGGGKPGPKGG